MAAIRHMINMQWLYMEYGYFSVDRLLAFKRAHS